MDGIFLIFVVSSTAVRHLQLGMCCHFVKKGLATVSLFSVSFCKQTRRSVPHFTFGIRDVQNVSIHGRIDVFILVFHPYDFIFSVPITQVWIIGQKLVVGSCEPFRAPWINSSINVEKDMTWKY
jgi:hypothetical protein